MNRNCWPRFGFVALVALMVCPSIAAVGVSDNSVTVVSGNNPDTSSDGLTIYVKFNGKVVLFCAGGATYSLPQYLEGMGLDPAPIEAVVLFDSHPSDFQGLPGVLKATARPPKVYVSAVAAQEIFRKDLQAEVVAVTKPTTVLPGAWLLGPAQLEHEGKTLAGHVLVLDQPDGLVVVVSCENPGIVPVVEKVREIFGYRKIKMFAGRFDLQGTSKTEIREISLRLQQKGVKTLALSSCTGNAALKIFRQEWGDRIVSFDPGDTVRF